jgi:hypothetical protein
VKVAETFKVEVTSNKKDSKVKLTGTHSEVVKCQAALLAHLAKSSKSSDIKYPDDWTPQKDNCEKVPVGKSSSEWTRIEVHITVITCTNTK